MKFFKAEENIWINAATIEKIEIKTCLTGYQVIIYTPLGKFKHHAKAKNIVEAKKIVEHLITTLKNL